MLALPVPAPRLLLPERTRPRLLDLFCGAGGAGWGYYLAGFEVTGVDIRPQPHYPKLLRFIQGDALEYVAAHGHEYDVIHASPPCQRWSKTYALPNVGEYPDLLTPVRDLMIAIGKPYIIENVPGAPLRAPIKLTGPQFGLRVIRERRFEINPWMLAPAPVAPTGGTGSHRGYSSFARGAAYITVAGNNYAADDGRSAMGISWMPRAELSEAIPPAYTRYIGEQMRRALWTR